MPNIKIVTDSTCDLPPSVVAEYGITVVPVFVHLGEQTFRAGKDLTNEQFYRRLQEGQHHPRTSPPPASVFEQLYRELLRDYDGVLSLHLSSRLGGVLHAAQQARSKLPASLTRVEVIDSLSASMGLGMIVLEAARYAQSGASVGAAVGVATGGA